MKYFKHDSNANMDSKLKKLRMRYGMQGYGVYWYCLELIAAGVEKHNLNFPLLTDEGGRAAESLGIMNEDKGYSSRVTFLLAPDGNVAKVYPEVSPETHADEILDDAGSM